MTVLGRVEDFRRRLRRLRLTPEEFELGWELSLLETQSELMAVRGGAGDAEARQLEGLTHAIEERLRALERAAEACPFIEPAFLPDAGQPWHGRRVLSPGDISVVRAAEDLPVVFTFRDEKAEYLGHVALVGKTGAGKSTCLMEVLAQVRDDYYVLAVTTNDDFRRHPVLAREFAYATHRDLRLNSFDALGRNPAMVDRVAFDILGDVYGLEYGELVGSAVCDEMRQVGAVPNWTEVYGRLQAKRYMDNPNNRRWRDSAVLLISNLLAATAPLYQCAVGMDLREVVRGRTILDLSELTTKERAFVLHDVLSQLHTLHLSRHARLEKPLLFVIDEAQLVSKYLAPRMLDLRHARIRVLAGLQHPSRVPVEMLGNMDALLAFQVVGDADRDAVGRWMSLTPEQRAWLHRLEAGQCVCCMPRWSWKLPFRAQVVRTAGAG